MVYIKRYTQPAVSAKELGVCSEPLPTNVVRTGNDGSQRTRSTESQLVAGVMNLAQETLSSRLRRTKAQTSLRVRAADRRLCFLSIKSIIPELDTSKIAKVYVTEHQVGNNPVIISASLFCRKDSKISRWPTHSNQVVDNYCYLWKETRNGVQACLVAVKTANQVSKYFNPFRKVRHNSRIESSLGYT